MLELIQFPGAVTIKPAVSCPETFEMRTMHDQPGHGAADGGIGSTLPCDVPQIYDHGDDAATHLPCNDDASSGP